MSVSDVFFDLDHTLWDFEKNSALAFETIFEKHKIEVNLEHFLGHYVPINLEYWERYRKEIISQSQLRYGRLKDTFDLLDYKIEDESVVFLSEEYVCYLPQFNHLFDGAIELLDYLKPKYNLHIITNGFHEIQNNKLNNSNIGHYFQTITNSEMAGVKKPNPLIFEYALNKANAKKENSIMIGDCMEADINGALDFGLDAILFNENCAEILQDIKQVSHLLELKKYL
ncbi:YjjG family noncanonical pyrimidine nucleotidase [Flavobacterium sp.]|uniref:YjjG family noncanonical pyrimidine nucleotidase n=1 Tax=Flavobacterium sp. TaxID=239 RepID=UPI002B4B1D29|nr:YjjG family noncanonical pyrimidine nucleotidase [Flavobacterium sp.]HLF52183.1 YjjG family noncanonical pyrimidine nucleotidase [Flavobacterium sp.]